MAYPATHEISFCWKDQQVTQRLAAASINSLPPSIAVPNYDRSNVQPGIVHLGLGAFHRAHQAVFIDDCLNRGETAWGIIAASLRSPDTRDALDPQDGLYTLAIRDAATESLRVIASISSILVAPENPQALLEILAGPEVRIVTLTVTEKGYTADLTQRALMREHPDVVHDVACPRSPKSALGFLAESIRMRRHRGLLPFTILSCDNLPANGKTLKALLIEFAGLLDDESAGYIEQHVRCPSSMVDRIVPATSERDRETISQSLGVVDKWPVVSEPFHQWVIEDDFPTGRPCLELSGVEFVQDVEPFENMKLRLLNGAHSCIAAIGRTAGLETVADVFADARARRFIDIYWHQAAATLAPDIDATSYTARLRIRFANSALHHRTAQIATDASQKIPQRILVPLRELAQRNLSRDALIFAVAAWMRSCMPNDEKGNAISLNDPLGEQLVESTQSSDPKAVVDRLLSIREIFDDFCDPAVADQLANYLHHICKVGVLEAAGSVSPANTI